MNKNLFALIDCGTNIFKMLVVQISSDKSFKVIDNIRLPVKIGKGSVNDKRIAKKSWDRGISAMNAFSSIINLYGIKRKNIIACATAALRNMENGIDFKNVVKNQSGINIKIISGKREAELIFKGVLLTGLIEDQKTIIMDVGGGSVEFIIADKKNLYWKKSFKVGVTRIMNIIETSDPISTDQIKKIEDYLFNELKELFYYFDLFRPEFMIGTSGSFDSVVKMSINHFGDKYLHSEKFPSLNKEHFTKLYDLIVPLDYDGRSKINGLDESRVDISHIAFVLLKYVLDKLKINKVYYTNYSLRHGIINEIISKD